MCLSSVIPEYLRNLQAKITRILAQAITGAAKRHRMGAWIMLACSKTTLVFIEKDPTA